MPVAIQSFANRETLDFFETGRVEKRLAWLSVQKIVLRKLDMLHYASNLLDLRSPPGNRLEALSGDMKGFYSIRVNDQWRIVFRWGKNGPEDVKVADYH